MSTLNVREVAADLMLDHARDILDIEVYAHIGQTYDDVTVTRSDVEQITTLIRESGIDITWPDGEQDTEVARLRAENERLMVELARTVEHLNAACRKVADDMNREAPLPRRVPGEAMERECGWMPEPPIVDKALRTEGSES